MRMIPNIRDKSFYYFWQLMRLDWYEHKLIVLDGKNLPIKINEEDLEKNQFGTTYYADYFDKYFQEKAISLSYTRSPYHFPSDYSGYNPIFLKLAPVDNTFEIEEVRIQATEGFNENQEPLYLKNQMRDYGILEFEEFYLGKDEHELIIKEKKEINIKSNLIALFSYENEMSLFGDDYEKIDQQGFMSLGEEGKKKLAENSKNIESIINVTANGKPLQSKIKEFSTSEGLIFKWITGKFKVETVFIKNKKTNKEKIYSIIIRKNNNDKQINFLRDIG